MNEGIRQIIRKDGTNYTIRNNRKRVFTPDEWNLFYSTLKYKREKLTFTFLINTGARINEARNVKVKDINFKKQRITLRITKKKSTYADGKMREIPISKKFAVFLEKYIAKKKFKSDDYLGILYLKEVYQHLGLHI